MYLQALATPKAHPNIIKLRNFLKAENDRDIVRRPSAPTCALARAPAAAVGLAGPSELRAHAPGDRAPRGATRSTWSSTSWRRTCTP